MAITRHYEAKNPRTGSVATRSTKTKHYEFAVFSGYGKVAYSESYQGAARHFAHFSRYSKVEPCIVACTLVKTTGKA